ncbi:hypothetical protein HK103_002296 [Boothiomyces macroporosus]|uniref:Uncharacterized protein n=1 Tax=Boothiomyces macroporosus TaxID=261099 RepID=A0AAD5UIY0_9FUNG|nr:hypothetical protein HK103_002296 [Boothiomyces macroporosus]
MEIQSEIADRKFQLELLKNEIKTRIKQDYKKNVKEQFPPEVLALSIKDFIENYGGSVEKYHKKHTRQSRRITIQQDQGVDLAIMLPKDVDRESEEEHELESLSKEDLLKLQESLRAAEEKTRRLLANFGM